jgi:GNAT superfamily N-acetyltransferase
MIVVRPVGFAAADAAALVTAAEADMIARYGGNDATVLAATDFEPPDGRFVVAYVDGAPAGCGGWRTLPGEPTAAEIKRMFTVPEFRGRGVARAVLAALEEDARTAGRKRVALETGSAQPEAIAMYERLGYERIAGFGYYADYEDAVSFGRAL